jgi:hypothetical protein
MFVYFDKLWDDLISLKKRYTGKVSAQEVTAYMLGALPSFYSYLKSIAHFAIMDCAFDKAFHDIEKNEFFKVRVGPISQERISKAPILRSRLWTGRNLI